MTPSMFIFGCGYTAQALIPQLKAQHFQVMASSRTPNHKDHQHLDITFIDNADPNMEMYLRSATHVLVCIPPTIDRHDIVLVNYAKFIKKLASRLEWFGYLSSTGVYGNHQGNWVDENSPCIPHTTSAITRFKVEQEWISFAQKNSVPLHIFRLSGIYGPGRNILDRLMQGKKHSIFKEHQVFSRIHVADIASTLMASIAKPNPFSVYNVSDDEPAPSHIVDEYAAQLMKCPLLPLIPYTEAHLSAMEQEFYANNRRVSNLKIKQDFHLELQYPTYREGLTQIWQDQLCKSSISFI